MPRWVPILLCLAASTGCAVTLRGLVEPAADGAILVDPEGRSWTLDLRTRRARLLTHLDGEGIELSGARRGARIRVDDWSLREGTHGLQAFFGPIREVGGVVVVQDEVSGGPVRLDKEASNVLSQSVGEMVLIEGYVEGAQAVRVVYYRVLAETEAPE